LLPLEDGQEILTIEYLSPEQVPDNLLGKNSIVDVNCIDNTGRSFIVEMQSEWSNIFRKRLLVNGSKAVIKQLNRRSQDDRARKFKELKPVYVLAILNGNFSKGKDWYHHLKIMDTKNPDIVIDGLDYVLLELPNFTPETWSYAHKKLAVLWLRFLKEMGGYCEKLPEEFVSNELILSAINICEESAFSPEEIDAYDHAEMEMIWQNSIRDLEDEAIESRKLLKESKKAMEEKDNALAEKEKEIEELKRLLTQK
jgi:predicted transposase/invertase (TIGR01784 family)